MLWRWTRTYHSVYELPPDERPSDKIINDDVRFDKWAEAREREYLIKAKKHGSRMSDDEVWQHTPKFTGNAS